MREVRVIDPSISATDLVLSYGSSVAIERSSFTIPAGKVTAVIGPNGSGKSTLLNAVAGLLPIRSGSIDFHTPSGREDVSYVLQTTKVNYALPITVREVVAMGRYPTTGWFRWLDSSDRAIVDEAMRRVGITDIARRHLDELSGGQRQRVFVAQGLAQDHSVLLLDEPLTGIDLTTAHAIDEVIHDETSRGCTVVMTTHDLSEAQFADNVLLLSGRVVASGPPDEVLSEANLVSAYGPSLLHVDDGGKIFIDDPAHSHLPGRHAHRDRVIHMEAVPDEAHGSD
ncbi:MAG TPA: metal ABC transporter ATP-binding protein [Acidimicrobiia bacterium]|nr:metal ABC transporter ATP-binding protein [Acidimicrobiia bacterium]